MSMSLHYGTRLRVEVNRRGRVVDFGLPPRRRRNLIMC